MSENLSTAIEDEIERVEVLATIKERVLPLLRLADTLDECGLRHSAQLLEDVAVRMMQRLADNYSCE